MSKPKPKPKPKVEDSLPKALEALTEDECYLAAILMDETGLELAEFIWVDDSNAATKGHRCYRAYPYQWRWWRCPDDQQIDQCGRSVGKSERIKARVCAFPFNYFGQEMVLIAPEGKHVDAITNRIERAVRQSRLLTYMLVGASWTNGINHRPFQLNFETCTFYTRLPGRDGTGVKGIHPAVLEVDEGQDITERTWKELPEVIRSDLDNVKWLVHGVSKGVRDTFYNLTYNSDWTVHRITGMHRPDWNAEEKRKKIGLYGHPDSPDYKRNVLGIHGESMNRIFVLKMLSACEDDFDESDYNSVEYYQRDITYEAVAERASHMAEEARVTEITTELIVAALLDLVQFPDLHIDRYTRDGGGPGAGGIFWAGMDVGLVNDPSEIVVGVEYEPTADERQRDASRKIAVPDKGLTRIKVLARIRLIRIPNPYQVELIMSLIDHYRPRAFSMDGTGIGLALWQDLQARAGKSPIAVFAPPPDASDAERLSFYAAQAKARSVFTVIKSYNFSEKLVVGFRDEEVDKLGPNPPVEDMIEKAAIRKYAKDHATDVLRNELVDVRRFMFPHDPEIRNQMNGAAWGYNQEPIDAYGNRRMNYSNGEFHILDAMRMLALGWSMQRIEELIATRPPPRKPVQDYFG